MFTSFKAAQHKVHFSSSSIANDKDEMLKIIKTNRIILFILFLWVRFAILNIASIKVLLVLESIFVIKNDDRIMRFPLHTHTLTIQKQHKITDFAIRCSWCTSPSFIFTRLIQFTPFYQYYSTMSIQSSKPTNISNSSNVCFLKMLTRYFFFFQIFFRFVCRF